MALRMAIEAQIILLQPLCGMRYFRNSGSIISLYQDEFSDDTLFKLLRTSYSKNVVKMILMELRRQRKDCEIT
jgi:hypothetical protein